MINKELCGGVSVCLQGATSENQLFSVLLLPNSPAERTKMDEMVVLDFRYLEIGVIFVIFMQNFQKIKVLNFS